MPSDPYKTPSTQFIEQPDRLRWPSLLLSLCTLVLLITACWCFYVSNALTLLSARDAGSIEQIEQLAQDLKGSEAAIRRDALVEYFELNRSFLLDDIRYQRSAQVNFIVVGVLLALIFALQVHIALHLRRHAADPP